MAARGVQAGSPGPYPAQPIVPRQLPAAVRYFAGRAAALETLAGLAATVDDCAVSAAITGTAGVGKTALANHFAHQIAESFPDGRLYVNLRGFDPVLPPMPPAEAIRVFLDAFAVPAERIPADLAAQVGLYRSLLAGQRVLMVLDNAISADQVRPLLPASPSCLVIITSRNRLAGLVAIDGTVPVSLDLLSHAEARDLLTGVLGADRVAAENDVADQLIELCGRLPLALRITAARIATRPGLPLAVSAAELADATQRLDALHTPDDPLASVRIALASSYDHLSCDAGRTFRLLGVHPGPDISAPAVARLAGIPGPQAPSRHTWRTATPSARPRPSGCSTTTCTPAAQPPACSVRPGSRSAPTRPARDR
jgi:hypothetical protein